MNSKAFTLVEVLIGIFVLSIIVVLLASLTVWLLRSNVRIQIETEVLENVQAAMQRMTYEIREADSIYFPTSNSGQFSLETNIYLPEGETFSYVDFFLCDGRLCLKQEGESPVALTSGKVEVTDLQFNYFGTSTPSVQIELSAEYKNPSDNPQYDYSIDLTSFVNLRSY